MMTRWSLALVLLPLVAAAPADPDLQAIEQLRLAYRLAAEGEARADPHALLFAARLLVETPATDAPASGRVVGGRADASTKAGRAATDAATLLDHAAVLAGDDAGLHRAIAALRLAATKGVAASSLGQGPVRAHQRLPAGARYEWSGKARPSQAAIVSAIGDGDTDINLEVLDAHGRTLCHDDGPDYYPVCRWQPAGDGRFRVRVTNQGPVFSDVVLLSN